MKKEKDCPTEHCEIGTNLDHFVKGALALLPPIYGIFLFGLPSCEWIHSLRT